MSNSIRTKDGQEIDRCIECGRDWGTVKHSSQGRCRGCARMRQHKEAILPQKWSDKYDYCQNSECNNTIDNITSVPHNADGLCRSCYSKKQRNDNHWQSLRVESQRREIKRNENN